jgi:hypothetical protein
MRLTALVGVALALAPHSVHAQTCAGGAVLVKNDTMAANLVWPFQSRPITSIGAGDAAGCVIDVSGIAPVVRIDSAAVGFVNGFNSAGIQAPANLAIHDGIAWNGNLPVLGPKVFDYATATSGGSITLTTNGINVVNIGGFGVDVCSGTLVLAWTMLVGNLGATNIATDGVTQMGFGCDPLSTPPMRNLVFRPAIGWRDCTATTYNGLPFCPFNYSGNWLMRACVSSAPFFDTISIAGSPIHSPGTGVVTFHFPVNPGVSYIGAASFATSPDIPTPIGIVPLADDALLALSLTTPSVFVGFAGTLDSAGTATGSLVVPPGIGPASFFIAAVAYSSTTSQLLAITNPAPVAVW